MGVNNDKPAYWKRDISDSVDYYNNWFVKSAPAIYRKSRTAASKPVSDVFDCTESLKNVTPEVLYAHPQSLPVLRMATCPPIARDRLVGLSQVPRNFVYSMESAELPQIPNKTTEAETQDNLERICKVLVDLLDYDILPWLKESREPLADEKERALLVIADRLCGALSNPVIRNSQEQRQLQLIREWLESKGYKYVESKDMDTDAPMPGTFAFRHNISVFTGEIPGSEKKVNIPVDVCIIKKTHKYGDCPILIEAKSAGDFANVNKRRKEEAKKMSSLRNRYGSKVCYILLLSGYFDTGYLGYEAAEGIDWVWEHRISDLEEFGL